MLGAGSFGFVCHCRCLETNREIAVKLTQYNAEHPSAQAKALINEYNMLCQL